jgi:hypothetical protein
MGVLLMAMTIGGLIVAVLVLAVSIATRKTWLRNFVFGGVAVWFAFYFAMLIGFSLRSEEKELSLNDPKEFCGFYLDCHMHTAVTDVQRTKTIGNRSANGEFYIVKVRVFSNAKQATLGLLGVDAHVVDASGRTYSRDSQAETLLPPQEDFERRISPVENFEKEIVFDLPEDVSAPRLDIREGYGIDHVIEALLVDDEDSVLHKRAYFKLESSGKTAAIK